MPEFSVRLRTDADLPAAARALTEVYQRDGYPVEGVAEPERWLTPDGLIEAWVGAADTEVAGHVLLTEPRGEEAVAMLMDRTTLAADDIAVLARLFVLPSARGQSIGQRLVAACLDHARAHGLSLVLDVMAKDEAAIRLYERGGWRLLGPATHAFGEADAVPAYCYAAPGVLDGRTIA